MAPVLEVDGLAVAFPEGNGWRRVVDGVCLAVGEGEVVGLVGESGCGKTLTALALLGLVPEPGRIVSGSVRVRRVDVLAADDRLLSTLRGGVVGLVFQEPAQALNPVRTVGFQVGEAARIHRSMSRRGAARLAVELLEEVGLEQPQELAAAYPHQLSGGQRQRALLACALSADPAVLIADEPTSALDTVAQLHFADLLMDLHRRRGLAVLFVSHDVALVSRLADRITVLYAGETAEVAARAELLGTPLHPYTQALLRAQPRGGGTDGERFASVPGKVPHPGEWGSGCRFAPRCPSAFEPCRRARPALTEPEEGRRVRCFLVGNVEEPDGDP